MINNILPGPVEAVRAAAMLAAIHLDGRNWKELEAVLDDMTGRYGDTTFDARGGHGLDLCRAGFFAAVARCRAAVLDRPAAVAGSQRCLLRRLRSR